MADKYNKSRNETRHARMAAGICRDCGKVPPAKDKVICLPCFETRKRQRNERVPRMIKEGKCIRCAKSHDGSATLCRDCMSNQMNTMRVKRYADKRFVINHYGGICVDCAETDIRCLTLDHVNNDGKEEDNKRNRAAWYARLVKTIRAGIPHKYQLAIRCFNCHAKKDLFAVWSAYHDALGNS